MAGFKATFNYSQSTSTNRNIDGTKSDNYNKFPRENIDLLKEKMFSLVGLRKDFEKINTQFRTEVMKNWITAVLEKEPEIEILLQRDRQGSKWRSSERVEFGNAVERQLKAVEELEKQGRELKEESGELLKQLRKEALQLYELEEPRTNSTLKLPTPRHIGMECNLEKMIKCITGTEFAVIGICGACGMGKTALLEEIERVIRSKFSKLIQVDVTSTLLVDNIQNKLAESLELVNEGKQNFSKLKRHERANKICEALAKHTFLLMLDDVWTAVNFGEIGIPSPEKNSGSKIVYTTRLTSISGMYPDKIVAMEPLSLSHSFELFRAHRPQVRQEDEEIARKIVEKCAGLPLALNIVGWATAGRGLSHIYNLLNDSPTDIEGMKEMVLRVLKPSFDALMETTKRCFLFCSLFQDSKDINRNRLADYWIGEGLVHNENENIRQLRDRANDIVEQLLGCCLLEESCDKTHVKMHYVVHTMAIWLLKESTHEYHLFQFYAGEEFRKNEIERMKQAKRASFVDTDTDLEVLLKNIPDCKELLTLLMSRLCESRLESCRNRSISIPDRFFHEKKMPNCRVLDMSYQPISKVPGTLGKLKHLRYLNLSYTFIAKLPSEMGNLKKLLQLDLTGTMRLQSIPRKAISSLTSLRSLKLHDSNYYITNRQGQLSLESLEQLQSLEEIQIPLQNMEILKILLQCAWLSKHTTYLTLAIDSLDITKDEVLKTILQNFASLELLSLKSCRIADKEMKIHLEDFVKLKTLVLQEQDSMSKLTITCLEEKHLAAALLHKLHIVSCNKLTSITCLCQLNNLQILVVAACEEIIELLSETNAIFSEFHNHAIFENGARGETIKMFPSPSETSKNAITFQHQDHTQCLGKLKSLTLDRLPKLKSISHCNLPFEHLNVMYVSECENLRRLHINPTNEWRKIKISCEKKWWEKLEWKDDIINSSSFLVPF